MLAKCGAQALALGVEGGQVCTGLFTDWHELLTFSTQEKGSKKGGKEAAEAHKHPERHWIRTRLKHT